MSQSSKSDVYFIGVDVGSASVRGGLFNFNQTNFVKTAVEAIGIYRQTGPGSCHMYRISQSSQEIWQAVCKVVRDITSDVDVSLVKGIGFDATCSLVVVGSGGHPVNIDGNTKSKDGEAGSALDIVMWMDHRASEETDFINRTLAEDSALRFVGGQVSVEMELPKILWIKNHMPDKYKDVKKFMDLCDFLTWKASDDTSRSMCTVVCKWLYQVDPSSPSEHHWDKELLNRINLEELTPHSCKRIGSTVVAPGIALGKGLTETAASEMGLLKGTPVATGLIDAHAGMLALSYCSQADTGQPDVNFFGRLSLICGTSTCFMINSRKPVFVNGVWGPYHIFPDSWTTEGGQSSAGQFLDHIIQIHPYYISTLRRKSAVGAKMSTCYSHLNNRVEEITREKNLDDFSMLSSGLHIFPDFHGNRSPLSSPDIKGMITGLTLDGESELSLIKTYVAAMQSLAYESRWIIEVMEEQGIQINDIAMCGGLAHNPLFVRTLTDIVSKPIILPEIQESVMLGSAILAAAASGHFPSLHSAGAVMGGCGKLVNPSTEALSYHAERYRVFRKIAQLQQELLHESKQQI